MWTLWLGWACGTPDPVVPPVPRVASALDLHTPRVVEVVDGVHVAIGFGLANSILLEGEQGVVIVDAMESGAAARDVLAAFRAITEAPVRALIVTHNHADHVFGSAVMAAGDVPVYAHATTGHHLDRVVNVMRDVLQVRGVRMFGTALAAGSVQDAAIGPRLRLDLSDIALKWPTHTFEDHHAMTVAGLRIELAHAPGETDDQLFVWLPDRKILLPGDNIYQAFPNLYTIRGTPPRDVLGWVDSLDAMRDLGAEVMIPSHTLPLVGADAIAETLTAYRDGIQYVHDQTVRHMLREATPDELAATIRLPPHLAAHPWLAERYGTVAWSVRSVYDRYLGWFDGDASRLEPVPPAERARRFVDAFAAGTPLPAQARAAAAAGELAWAAELGRLWVQSNPDDGAAKTFLAEVYEARGRDHGNMNARHWYLTTAAELRGTLTVTPRDARDTPPDLVTSLPVEGFMRAMPTRLAAERVLDVDEVIAFDFTDLGETWVLRVRRGVAEMRRRHDEGVTHRIVTDSATWRRVAAGQLSPALAMADGRLRAEGGLVKVARVLSWFER